MQEHRLYGHHASLVLGGQVRPRVPLHNYGSPGQFLSGVMRHGECS